MNTTSSQIIPSLFDKYCLKKRGVIHLGAHTGEELDTYIAMGFERIFFVEPNPAAFAQLRQRIATSNLGGTKIKAVMGAVSDHNGVELLHIADNSARSSLVPIAGDIGELPVHTSRLDSLIQDAGETPANYNFLNVGFGAMVDEAMKGAPLTLSHMDAVTLSKSANWNNSRCLEGLDPVTKYGEKTLYVRTPFLNLWQSHPSSHGRFGNLMFQYMFARIFAKRHGLELHTSPWEGQQLFGLNDPPIVKMAGVCAETGIFVEKSELAMAAMPESKEEVANIAVSGLFQFHTAFYRPYAEMIRGICHPTPVLKSSLCAALEKVASGHRLICVHLRRGDYDAYGCQNHPMFYGIDYGRYCEWIRDTIKKDNGSTVVYIASDDPTAAESFAEFNPITAKDLGIPSIGVKYDDYVDFWMLTQADYLAISNSTFSFVASMLNESAASCWRPVKDGGLIPFDPWDSDPLLGRVEDEALRKAEREKSEMIYFSDGTAPLLQEVSP